MYMGTPDFARQMFFFWRDTFKMGETAMLDTAPAFAARLEGDTAPRGGDPSAPREAPHPRTEPPCR